MSVGSGAKLVRRARRLRSRAELSRPATAVISEGARLGLAFTVVIGDTVAQRRRRDIDFGAMLRVLDFRLLADIDDILATLAHGLHHPDEIISVRIDHVGEVKAAAAALRTGDDEQVGKALGMQPKESPGPFAVPFLH